MDDRPDLILFMSSLSARTQFILPNQDHIDSLPFDGITVNIPQGWSAFQPGQRFNETDIRTWLEPLRDFGADRHNWLSIYVDDPGDVFDDAAWADVVHNWKLMARVANDLGFEGIQFDNEEYGDRWQNWPDGYSDAQAARGLTAYQDQTALRGRQIAEAVASEWSDAKIMFCHGPYVSAPYPNDRLPNQWGDPEGNALYGAFFTGMAEGAGPDMRLVDGGELYALRSLQQFQEFHDFRSQELPGIIPWDVDPDLLANWDDRIDQAVMIYTEEFPPGVFLTPQTLVPTLLNAFDTAEEAVYLFTQASHFDWLTPGEIPADWVAAVERAIALADNTRSGTATGDRLVGSAVAERLQGLDGIDHLLGAAGGDWLLGGGGADSLRGGAGDDDLFGGTGADSLSGGRGRDQLTGDAGADRLSGGAGRDRLDGGAGDDVLTGGAHGDVFVLRQGSGQDRVTDFDPGLDRIDLPGNQAPDITLEPDGVHVRFGAAELVLEGLTSVQSIAFV